MKNNWLVDISTLKGLWDASCMTRKIFFVEMQVNEAEVKRLEEQASTMAPNMSAIEQYRKKVDLYLKRVAELDQVSELRAEQVRQETDAKNKRLNEFMAGFNVITMRLKEMYQMLTQGESSIFSFLFQ